MSEWNIFNQIIYKQLLKNKKKVFAEESLHDIFDSTAYHKLQLMHDASGNAASAESVKIMLLASLITTLCIFQRHTNLMNRSTQTGPFENIW